MEEDIQNLKKMDKHIKQKRFKKSFVKFSKQSPYRPIPTRASKSVKLGSKLNLPGRYI